MPRSGDAVFPTGPRSSRQAPSPSWSVWPAAPAADRATAGTPADSRDELRPLYANSMDIAEGKQLAQRFCADCHGADGISTIAGVPNLAGQRAPYLYREMRAYLSGARGNDTMNGAITYLSADAIEQRGGLLCELDSRAAGRVGRREGRGRCGAGRQGRRGRPAPGAMARAASPRCPAFPAWSGRSRNISSPP